MIDYEKLEKSLKYLENQYQNYQSADSREELFQIDKDAFGTNGGLTFIPNLTVKDQ
jgi:hypothetical protein